MRTIKFRAKSFDGEWVCGDLHLNCKFPHIHTQERRSIPIDTTTIDQFTGLTDKNGKEIYEGDILLYNGNMRAVEWKYGTFGLSMHENGFPFQAFYELPVPIVESTVIGNIHNNLELLKGGTK